MEGGVPVDVVGLTVEAVIFELATDEDAALDWAELEDAVVEADALAEVVPEVLADEEAAAEEEAALDAEALDVTLELIVN
jgi:hypothetical protein